MRKRVKPPEGEPVQTAADLYLLASQAPIDGLQRYLLQHAACLAAAVDAVELDPPSWGQFGRGRCHRCATNADVEMPAGVLPPLWWHVLIAAMAVRNHDLFAGPGVFHQERYRRCVAGVRAAVVRCALLADVSQDEIAQVH